MILSQFDCQMFRLFQRFLMLFRLIILMVVMMVSTCVTGD